jgi:hypothetical protein
MALNHARLPVPPLTLAYALNLRKAVLSGCSGSIAAVQIASDAANCVSGDWKQLGGKTVVDQILDQPFPVSGP